eukprot:COSAG01_NODE_31349_length_599_cov_0.922000_1_plen_67_part_01
MPLFDFVTAEIEREDLRRRLRNLILLAEAGRDGRTCTYEGRRTLHRPEWATAEQRMAYLTREAFRRR